MASTYTLLADLRARRCSNTAEVRLLRFWEARNINKGGELMSVDMLLLDENSTLVHGSVSALRQLRFRQRLTEGSVYNLSGFDVAWNSPKFRLSDGPVSICFNEETAFEKTSVRNIPTEHFRFRSYDQILELANTGKQLPDVMGELCAIRSTITDRIPGAQRVMLTLRLERDSTIRVSLFDSLALAFHSKLDCYGREPRIVIATGINPKMVAGGGTDQSASSSKVVQAQKTEPIHVCELNQFVVTAEPQIIEFLCTAKGVGATAQVDVDLPCSLADIVGNTYTFQLKLKYFNFFANHQTFTISRIFPAQELAPIPTLEEGADVTEPALLQNVAAAPEGIAAITSSVAAPSPEADGTFSQREELAAEEADLAGNAISSSTSQIHLDFTISLLKLRLIVTTDLLMAVPSVARYLSQLPLLFLILMMLFFTSPMENRGISSPVRGEIGLKVYIPNEASLKSYAAAPTHPDNLDPAQPTSTY
ncbi:unnamed protein product [Brassica rapa]|uniref:Replication protein A 70 kDa DNA-binding subunit B/D first OB fold domain-containing protein n=1 Tax=Brassica campestris TaxID=3711 RepID=A0A3P5XZ88_BRACM|nr:unnamed protein product [Brassica rapa]VDC60126.1 unnamed protein product [Brassica rapa]